jgi:glycosyltransferase involved in cell wall biosynthesis
MARRFKVAHVMPAYYPARVYGGPTESTYQLTRHLARRGLDVRVLTTDADGLERVVDVDKSRELELAPGLRARYCPRRLRHAASPALLRWLPGYVRWSDVVHLTAVYNFTTLPTLALCAALDRPVVWSLRGALQRWEGTRRLAAKAVWEAACRAVAPRRLALHVTSAGEEQQSRGRVPGAACANIANGVLVPPEAAPRSPRRAGAPLRLLFVGRLDPIKGIENLLEACARLGERAGPWSLAIAGAGEAAYARRLHGLVARLDRGRMLGQVEDEAKARAFAEADLLVAPSFSENFGVAIAEALARGLPVIASRGTPWQRLEERGAGLWVDNDPAPLADAIARAAAMPLAAMGARGRAWVEETFSWDRIAADMAALYERLLSGQAVEIA